MVDLFLDEIVIIVMTRLANSLRLNITVDFELVRYLPTQAQISLRQECTILHCDLGVQTRQF